MIDVRSLRLGLLICVLILAPISSVIASASECQQGVLVPIGGDRNGIEIGKAWSGAFVIFDALARGKKIYFGYYDADRWLTVAQLDLRSDMVCRSRLSSQFAGWDSHNSVTLAFDGTGQLQVAGNMHDSPLVYGAADSPESIGNVSLTRMIGRDEDAVTYPTFVNSPDGKLYFAYRSGVSGNGVWFVNAFDGYKWRRVLDKPMFASVWNGSPTSAYPSALRMSEDGYVHLAIVWRRDPNVSTNYAITYARTRDFVHWTDHKGRPIIPPLDPGNSDMIEAPGEGNGLVNSARVSVTPAGKPIVAYTLYGPDGRNTLVLASPSGDRWRRTTIATAAHQTVIAGGGSVPDLPAFGDPSVAVGAVASIDVAFPGEPRKRIFFNMDTLRVADAPNTTAKPSEARPLDISPPHGLIGVRKNTRRIRIDGMAGKSAGSIIYFSQALNRDQVRKCTPSQPTACNPPPSPLIFVPQIPAVVGPPNLRKTGIAVWPRG